MFFSNYSCFVSFSLKLAIPWSFPVANAALLLPASYGSLLITDSVLPPLVLHFFGSSWSLTKGSWKGRELVVEEAPTSFDPV